MTISEDATAHRDAGPPSAIAHDAPPHRSRRLWIVVLVGVALVIGVAGRLLVSGGVANSFLADLFPWLNGTSVQLYFGDQTDTSLVPVSRTLTGDNESPEGLVTALLEGPAGGIGLVNLIPDGTVAHSVSVDGSMLEVDLSSRYLDRTSPLADEALVQSLASWPDVEVVRVTVDGVPLDAAPTSGHLLYFYDPDRDALIARPHRGETARDVLNAYMEGPTDGGLIGLPRDVEILGFESGTGSGLLELNMTYSPEVRRFATADGDAMRRVLEGLIATLTTGFPNTRFIYLDFEGHASLGLGQCANLLRTVQPPPKTLNDERLLNPPTGA